MNSLTAGAPHRRNTSFILSVRSFDSFDVMKQIFEALPRPPVLPAIVAAVAVVAAACGGGTTSESSPDDSTPPAAAVTETSAGADIPGSAAGPATYDFPTGEPVLVAADYAHPSDHVDNTGAYLPTNGKPTLVFVDAIW